MILSSNLRINLVYNMSDYLRAVLETQLIGAFRVAVTMPLEHILDRIKTYK
jgi:solute carrier family 25 citrate transporter 1